MFYSFYLFLQNTFNAINAQKNDEENANAGEMSGPTKNMISGLILVLTYLYDDKHTRDYHVALTKSFSHEVSANPVSIFPN